MSSRRSRLFLSLRLFFWANVLTFFVLVGWFFYLRSQRTRLIEVVERQLAFNIRLSSDLAYANHIITNRFFSAASSFASNVLLTASSSSASTVSPSQSSGNSFSQVKETELPPVQFNSYFTVNDIPYIRVRNTSFRQGDLLLGYPIQAISPDVVLYRDRFYKVNEVSK